MHNYNRPSSPRREVTGLSRNKAITSTGRFAHRDPQSLGRMASMRGKPLSSLDEQGAMGYVRVDNERIRRPQTGLSRRPKGSRRLGLDVLRVFDEMQGRRGKDDETGGEKPTSNILFTLRECENGKWPLKASPTQQWKPLCVSLCVVGLALGAASCQGKSR